MRFTYYIFSAILFVTFFASCSLKNNRQNTGFYGAWSDGPKAASVKPFSNELMQAENTSHPGSKTLNIASPKSLFDTGKCDIILLHSGEEIYGKVTEITLSEVKYHRCDNLEGPVLYLAKSSVFLIKYPNGVKDIVTPHVQTAPEAPMAPKEIPTNPGTAKQDSTSIDKALPGGPVLEGFGVIGMLVGLIGLFAAMPIWSLAICGLVATAFGLVSISKIAGNRDTKSGMFFALMSLLFGLIILGVLVLVGF